MRLSNCSNSAHSATAHYSPIASGSRKRTTRCSPRHACMCAREPQARLGRSPRCCTRRQRRSASAPARRSSRHGTRGGAVALDLPVGAIVPGMKADLALVRLDGFHVQPTRSSPAWSTRRVVPTWRWLWSGPRGGEGRTPRRHALGRLERARPPGRARASGIYVTRGSACARKNGRELRPEFGAVIIRKTRSWGRLE